MKKTDISDSLKMLIMEDIRALSLFGEDATENRTIAELKSDCYEHDLTEFQEQLLEESDRELREELADAMYNFGAKALLTEFYSVEEYNKFCENHPDKIVNPVLLAPDVYFASLREAKKLSKAQFASYVLEQLADFLRNEEDS